MENSIDQALAALTSAIKNGGSGEPIAFKDKIYGKGFLWSGKGYTKQLVLVDSPDRIFSSESIDIAKDKQLLINNAPVLSATELGKSVVKSNLREVGRLKGLLVDGSVSVNQYLFFDGNTDRLGLGTDEPNGALSVAEGGIEVIIGTSDFTKGMIGTFAHNDFQIVTDDTPRLTVTAGGDIKLGNDNQAPIKVSVHGKVSVGVEHPDPNADLHVKGNIKFNNTMHTKGSQAPQSGTWNTGDIVWNSKPAQRGYVGWICTQAGTPGVWCAFGEIR